MSNWRLIEAELERAALLQGTSIVESYSSDKLSHDPLNLTLLAQALANRLSPTARPVQVKAGAECKVSQPTECKV